jgi:hypothetical protein
VECAFGRLKSKFKILHNNDKYNDTEMFPKLIDVLCALHNFISREEGKAEPTCGGSWCSQEEEDAFQQDMLANPPAARGPAQDAQQDARGTAVRDTLVMHVELSKVYSLSKDAEESLCFDQE